MQKSAVNQKTEEQSESFVQIALQQKLLTEKEARQVVEHAEATDVSQSDAALTLSLLPSAQVDAIQHLQTPAALAPGYLLTGLIGCGASGIVFRARQVKLNREVAVKTINSSKQPNRIGLERMQREATAIAQLSHPNIVAAYDCGFHDGHFYIVMELVEGEDLAHFVDRSHRVPESTAWTLIRQIAAGLAHANKAGLIHRDIKPANILLTTPPFGSEVPEGMPFAKVADFGLAFQNTDMEGTNLTAQGITLGTPGYVAPEQLKDTHVDLRADIYSLGATAFHLLSGFPPLASSTPMQIIIDKSVGKDTWRNEIATHVSEGSIRLFRDMTEAVPDERIADYPTLLNRIDELLAVGVDTFPAQTIAHQAPVQHPEAVHGSTRTPTPAAPPDRQHRSKLARNVVLLVGVACLASAAIFSLPSWSNGGIRGAEYLTWTPSVPEEPLFFGRSIPLGLHRIGNWIPEQTDEGYVLVAQKNSLMDLPFRLESSPNQPDVRLRVSIRLVADARAQCVLSPSAALELGAGTASLRSIDGERKPVANTRAAELQDREAGVRAFHVCQFLRVGKKVTVSVDGELLGTLEFDSPPSMVTIQSLEGRVEFADLSRVGIAPPPLSPSPDTP